MEQDTGSDKPYVGYSYAYPHKTAYRSFNPGLHLSDLWANEPRDNLFLYVHVPFCKRRCGFCNLFTTTCPDSGVTAGYLGALKRQAECVATILRPCRVARLALGGGTPTVLSVAELEQLFGVMKDFAQDGNEIPFSAEVSVETVDRAKLDVMRLNGVTRVSIGVQTFDETEAKRLGRLQSTVAAERAISLTKEAGFQGINIDLIYGIPQQSPATWLESLRKAAAFVAEEVYLYPLYVRAGTGLARSGLKWPDNRLELYRIGRDFLLSRGYRQESMRMFRLADAAECVSPTYCCQEDGMVGLGPGARSYTRDTHYSNPYVVSNDESRTLVEQYAHTIDFSVATHGMVLTGDEQRRRFIIKSLLKRSGLDSDSYSARFGTNPVCDYPVLTACRKKGWLEIDAGIVRLTALGLEFSDRIGPMLYSGRVKALMSHSNAR